MCVKKGPFVAARAGFKRESLHLRGKRITVAAVDGVGFVLDAVQQMPGAKGKAGEFRAVRRESQTLHIAMEAPEREFATRQE